MVKKKKNSNFHIKLMKCIKAYFTFTGHAINVAELVATATVTLVGAVHVGTLLAAGVALTLIHIYNKTGWLEISVIWVQTFESVHSTEFSSLILQETEYKNKLTILPDIRQRPPWILSNKVTDTLTVRGMKNLQLQRDGYTLSPWICLMYRHNYTPGFLCEQITERHIKDKKRKTTGVLRESRWQSILRFISFYHFL